MYEKSEIKQLFPSPIFREHQERVLDEIVDAFNSGQKCVLVDAPPGFGKSFCNITMGRASKSAFYVTPQLSLIDQLVNDKQAGKYVQEIKGRQNYICGINKDRTVDVGVCELGNFKCENKAHICPYWRAKNAALRSEIALMSFPYFVLDSKIGEDKGLGKRKTLVIDEAHNIAEGLVGQVSLTLSERTLTREIYEEYKPQLRRIDDVDQAKNLVKNIFYSCNSRIKRLKLLSSLTPDQSAEYSKLQKVCATANTFYFSADKTEWIYEVTQESYGNKYRYKVVFQPLTARYFTETLWNKAEEYILSSGTFGDINLFIHETGLDMFLEQDEIKHIEVPSTFPVENRPIINKTCGKMTYQEKRYTLPKAIKTLETIIDAEQGNNMIVHCHSYDIANTIYANIGPQYKPLLMLHNNMNKQQILDQWKNETGKTLLSVALTEGQDFKDEICRAQVLFKVPFPNISEKRISVRLNKYHAWNWYYNQALVTIIQSYGRAVRSPTDWARYYVIDSSFFDVIKKCDKSTPSWFKTAMLN